LQKKAINLLASGVIIMHNHPSGNTQPSNEDKNITSKLKQTLSIMDINLLDHLIITDQNYLSFTDEGLL
jgi:DNA repair protein RadC